MPMNSSVSQNSAVVPILLAIILGGLSGWAIGPDARFGGFEPLRLFELLGTVFLNLLKVLMEFKRQGLLIRTCKITKNVNTQTLSMTVTVARLAEKEAPAARQRPGSGF